MKLKQLALLAGLSYATLGMANATIHTESGDAGDLMGSAQTVGGGTHQITGNLTSETDVDMYRFNWGGGDFAADTYGSNHQDPMLWLFDSSGRGVVGDDDSGLFGDGINAPYSLTAYISMTGLASGIYYLAISNFWSSPESQSGLMWQGWANQAPSGPGAADPVTGWSPYGYGYNDPYVINFYSPTAGRSDVPEPGTLALIGTGLLGLCLARRRRRA